MKRTAAKGIEQPKPFIPGITRAPVREHAMSLHRGKLHRGPLTLEDWMPAEKDLAATPGREGADQCASVGSSAREARFG